MRSCGPQARIHGRGNTIAQRQQRAIEQNRELVDWAGDLAYLAGSYQHSYEVVNAREVIYYKNGTRLISRRQPVHMPVWTSPAVVLGEAADGQLNVAVTKLDEMGHTRRARIGLFVVGPDQVDTSAARYSAHFGTAQQEGYWAETYFVGGHVGSHRNPDSQEPDYDELKIAVDNIWMGSGIYLSRAEGRLSALRVNYMDVVNTAIETNDHNQALRTYLANMSLAAA